MPNFITCSHAMVTKFNTVLSPYLLQVDVRPETGWVIHTTLTEKVGSKRYLRGATLENAGDGGLMGNGD